jgi:hypothetical protein
LLWLFVLVISGLMFLLSYLFLAMRRAMDRERMSLDFSLLAIERLEIERRRVARELHDSVLPLVENDPKLSGGKGEGHGMKSTRQRAGHFGGGAGLCE